MPPADRANYKEGIVRTYDESIKKDKALVRGLV